MRVCVTALGSAAMLMLGCADISGLDDLEFVDDAPACVPGDPATLCAGIACGAVDDGCGSPLDCPSTCAAGLTCGAGEVAPSTCGCAGVPLAPESCELAYRALSTGEASAYYVCALSNGGEPANWLQARDFCAAMGSALAVLPSVEEHELLFSLLEGRRVHIGLDDMAQEGTYVWADGTPMPADQIPVFFAPGEPNDADGVEDCVEMNGDTAKYNDIPCTGTADAIRFVCESACAG